MRGDYLSPVFPVSLVSVVLFRIMGRGDHHSTLAAEVSHCERKHRCRSHFPKIKNLDTICGQDVCGRGGKKRIVDPAVMSDGDLDLLSGKRLQQVICQ